MPSPSPRSIAGLILLASLGAFAAALVAQHVHGLQPCPWCILQRLILAVLAVAALVVWLLPRRAVVQTGAGLMVLAALAGAASAIYQNRVASKSLSCDLSLAEQVIGALRVDKLMPEIFEVRASCADAAVAVLGVPFELWTALLFVVLGTAAAWIATRPSR